MIDPLESSIAVEDVAIENCRFGFALLLKGFRHYSTTIARLNFLGGSERGGLELLPVWGPEIG